MDISDSFSVTKLLLINHHYGKDAANYNGDGYIY